MFDYLVAECLTCDQALDLSDQLTDDAIEILDDEMVRLCIFRGYLPFERALMLTDDDVNILNTDTVRELLKDKQPVNIDLLLTRRLIATSLYGFGTPASRNNLARLLTGLNNFALARNWLNVVTALTLETYQSGLSGSSGSDNSPDSTMDDLD